MDIKTHKENYKKLCNEKVEVNLKSLGTFPEVFHDKVKLEAIKRGMFMNILIQEAVREWLDNHPK